MSWGNKANLPDEAVTLLHDLYLRYGGQTFPVSVAELDDPRLQQLVKFKYVNQIGWGRGKNPKEVLFQVTREGQLSLAGYKSHSAHTGPFKVPGFFK